MRISLNWLKELIALDVDADELAERMTMLGMEIESVTAPGKDIQEVYVGQIKDIQPHPDADKLVVCQTDVGADAPLQIVCGATNMQAGDKVPTAVVGASLPGGFQIGRRKMRGLESSGMMCSARELNMGEDHAGLMILPDDMPVGQDIREALGLDDIVFEIEVTPNRGDWASMIGVARELAAYYKLEVRTPEIDIQESGEAATSLSSVTIEDSDLCPRYTGRILRDVVIKPSPPWMCARLMAAGQRPINNVVDITNYVLLETGHPLHAFDYDKLAENRVVARRAKPNEVITTLDEEKRQLSEDMLVIADAVQPQAVAGVMGGADSEVDDNSRHIFLESAYFNPRSVRRTARTLGMVTEAAQHFQRGADPEMAVYALNRAAMLMQQLADAKVAPGVLDEYPNKQQGVSVTLRYDRTVALLGASPTPEQQRTIITGLGFAVQKEDEHACTVLTPTWRHDVAHEADLIEEVARHFGYDNVPTTMPPVRQTDKIFAPAEKYVSDVRRFLVATGLTEIITWSFGNPEMEAKAGTTKHTADMVMLQNPLSENYAGMRTTLLPGVYTVAAYNHKRGAKGTALFEIGPVYHAVADETLPDEPLHLGIVLSGMTPGHWSQPERPVDFYDIKGCLEALFQHLGRTVALESCDCDAFQPGQGAIVKLRKHELGCIGKVAPAVTKAFDLPDNSFALSLNLGVLLDKPMPPAQFQDIPQFPPSLRDLAVVVDRTVTAGELVAAVKQAGGALLKITDIFDVYSGKPLPPDKKSVALSLVFQSPERTLTDKDTQKSVDRIVKRLQQDCGAELR